MFYSTVRGVEAVKIGHAAMNHRLIQFFCAGALVGVVTGQPMYSPNRPPPVVTRISAEVTGISEMRQPEGKCTVHLKFSDDSLTNKMGILRVRVTRALDESGTNLVPDESEPRGWSASGGFSLAPLRGWHDERPTSTRRATVTLRQSARGAASIKTLSGELDLYAPAFANGGIAKIENFRAHVGKPIQHPALEKLGVRLTYHTKESFESDVGRRPLAAARQQSMPDPPEQNLFPGILGHLEGGHRSYVVLQVDDPQNRIVSFAFRESSGRFLPVTERRSAGTFHGFYFSSMVTGALDLFVYLDTPEAVEKALFALDNIPLP
jgi:hypothetical protein